MYLNAKVLKQIVRPGVYYYPSEGQIWSMQYLLHLAVYSALEPPFIMLWYHMQLSALFDFDDRESETNSRHQLSEPSWELHSFKVCT